MKVKNESEVAQSCPSLCDPMGFSRQEYWSEFPLSSAVLDIIVVLRFFFFFFKNLHTVLSSQLPIYSPKDCRRIPFSPQQLKLYCWRIFEMAILTDVR